MSVNSSLFLRKLMQKEIERERECKIRFFTYSSGTYSFNFISMRNGAKKRGFKKQEEEELRQSCERKEK